MEKAQVQACYTAGKTEAQIRGRSQMIGTRTHKSHGFSSGRQNKSDTNPKNNKSSNIHYFSYVLFLNTMFSHKLRMFLREINKQ